MEATRKETVIKADLPQLLEVLGAKQPKRA